MFHKTSYMRGFHIHATDGGIGHVDDFLVDEKWNLRYLVIDTSNWPGGESVLLSPAAIEKIDSPHKKIYVNLTRAEVAAGPSVESVEITVIETMGHTIL